MDWLQGAADWNWSLISLVLVAVTLLSGYLVFEKSPSCAKDIALIGTLAALSGLGRVPFAAVPGLQPTTFVVLCSGYVLGPLAGFIIGSSAAFASNFFLGHGPWTPWQMLAWGMVGISSGMLKRMGLRHAYPFLLILSFLWGFVFGWLMNMWHWLTFVHPLTPKTLIAVNLTSIWFDSVHAVGNLVFMFLFGRGFVSILKRFNLRLSFEYVPPAIKRK